MEWPAHLPLVRGGGVSVGDHNLAENLYFAPSVQVAWLCRCK